VKRREFIAALGGAAAWPIVARAQQSAVPVVGCLINTSAVDSDWIVVPFRQGLADSGYVEGKNLVIEYRWGDGNNERMSTLADELLRLPVSVLAALLGASGALAAKRLTATTPIVFFAGGDAVELGLVSSLSRPEANLTGVSGVTNSLVTKQLSLLGEFASKSAPFAILTNPASPNTKRLITNTQSAAKALGRDLQVVGASDVNGIDAAFSQLVNQKIGGLVVPQNAFLNDQRKMIAALAARERIPTIYDNRESVVAGGLMSYGIDYSDVFRQLGTYTGRILRGAKPSDLPVFQPSRFAFVINLKTTQLLGLNVPIAMQLLADEVIE
jgi:putative ABC transport system substrate-binding protein